jgi:hypothetical protein
MPLKKSGPNYADQTGTSETITIQPIPPEPSTQVFFTAASYGTKPDTTPNTLSGVAGKKALAFNVLPGLNKLVFGLASPTPRLQSVNIMQGATLLSTVSVEFHSGTGSLRIMGTPATDSAAGGQN